LNIILHDEQFLQLLCHNKVRNKGAKAVWTESIFIKSVLEQINMWHHYAYLHDSQEQGDEQGPVHVDKAAIQSKPSSG